MQASSRKPRLAISLLLSCKLELVFGVLLQSSVLCVLKQCTLPRMQLQQASCEVSSAATSTVQQKKTEPQQHSAASTIFESWRALLISRGIACC